MVKSRSFSFSKVMLVLGLLFLYLPMFVLIVYSFNASRLVSVWAGFSTQWYGELFRDEQILSAVWMSLRIAFYSASMAVCLGTLCAFVITRFKKMRGRTLLSSMITAPLVMPEVITGLSLLLLFVPALSRAQERIRCRWWCFPPCGWGFRRRSTRWPP